MLNCYNIYIYKLTDNIYIYKDTSTKVLFVHINQSSILEGTCCAEVSPGKHQFMVRLVFSADSQTPSDIWEKKYLLSTTVGGSAIAQLLQSVALKLRFTVDSVDVKVPGLSKQIKTA